MSSIKGKVKWFNGSKGYLDEGDVLTFDIEDGKKGPSAVNLKKV